MNKFCLTISGSDPTCGAGAQLDLQVLNKVGVKPLNVISAITAQTSDKVFETFPIPEKVFLDQVVTMNTFYRSEFCKIGMITNTGVLSLINLILDGSFESKIILDPIIKSSSGYEFVETDILSELFKYSFLVTPNILEMEKFLDISIETQKDMELSLKLFNEKFGTPHILIKGGHLKNFENIDILFLSGKIVYFESKKVLNQFETHGTGCYLSSAIAGFLTLGFDLESSISKSKEMLSDDLQNSILYGKDIKGTFHLC
jgi:hydroxymethylpyrimidine/phosphomethylpyrimidine kinase